MSNSATINPLWKIVRRIQNQLHPAVSIATGNTTVTADSAQNGGAVVSNLGATGTVTVALPAAKVGMKVTALVQSAQALRLDPNGTETIALPTGVQQAAGKYITNSTIGSTIQLIVVKQGQWDVAASNGTFTAEA